MNLNSAGQPLSYEIAFLVAGLDNPEMPTHEIGDASNSAIYKSQALAIIVLLARGDSNGFYHNLIRSALWRLKFLNILNSQNIDDAYHQCAARTQGLVGALAARDFTTAREIIKLTPVNFRHTMEYEEDFCIARLIHHLVADDLTGSEIEDIVTRYSENDDEDAPRLRVLRSIMEKNEKDFDEAFSDLIGARTDAIEADLKRGQMEDPEIAAHRLVYIEGLAFLNLAEHHGMRMNDDYTYCPPAARVQMTRPFTDA